MTLTFFMARSTWVSYALEWVRLLKCYLKGKTGSKLANRQDIDYSEKKKGHRASSSPLLGAIFNNIQTFIGIYSRPQVSVYRTIGPLVVKER